MVVNSLRTVSSFLSCVQAVIASVLSFHVGIAFGQAFFFFSFLPGLVDELQICFGRLLSACWVTSNGVYAC